MKIVSLKKFLDYPPNTLFSGILPSNELGPLLVKRDNKGSDHFGFSPLISFQEHKFGTAQVIKEGIEEEKEFPVDSNIFFTTYGKWTSEEVFFAVYDREDLLDISCTLSSCFDVFKDGTLE